MLTIAEARPGRSQLFKNSVWVSQRGNRDPCPSITTCCFPGYTSAGSENLEQIQECQVLWHRMLDYQGGIHPCVQGYTMNTAVVPILGPPLGNNACSPSISTNISSTTCSSHSTIYLKWKHLAVCPSSPTNPEMLFFMVLFWCPNKVTATVCN